MAVIDAAGFPHIFALIISQAPPEALPALRQTCRQLKTWVDEHEMHHVSLTAQGADGDTAATMSLRTRAGKRLAALHNWAAQENPGQLADVPHLSSIKTLDLILPPPYADWLNEQLRPQADTQVCPIDMLRMVCINTLLGLVTRDEYRAIVGEETHAVEMGLDVPNVL